VGVPGAGKSTFCKGLCDVFDVIGRPYCLVNLDPASLDKGFGIDIRDLVSVEEVQDTLGLGPNGALIYCLELLQKNEEWLWSELDRNSGRFLIFDLPGQVESYCGNDALKSILSNLQYGRKVSLCSLHLLDASLMLDFTNSMSLALVSVAEQMMLGLPALHVVSKIDLVSQEELETLVDPDCGFVERCEGAIMQGKLKLRGRAYGGEASEAGDASARSESEYVESPRTPQGLARALCLLIDQHANLRFLPVSIKDLRTFKQLVVAIDNMCEYDLGALGEYTDASREDLEHVYTYLFGDS